MKKLIKVLLGMHSLNAGRPDGKLQFLKTDGSGTLYDRFEAVVLGDDGTPLASVAGKPGNGFVALNSNTVAAHAGQPEFMVGTEILVDEADFNRSVEQSAKNTTFPTFMLVFTNFRAETTDEMTEYKRHIATAIAIEANRETLKRKDAWRKDVRRQIALGQRAPINVPPTPPAEQTAKEGIVDEGNVQVNKKVGELSQQAADNNPANV